MKEFDYNEPFYLKNKDNINYPARFISLVDLKDNYFNFIVAIKYGETCEKIICLDKYGTTEFGALQAYPQIPPPELLWEKLEIEHTHPECFRLYPNNYIKPIIKKLDELTLKFHALENK